jgi:hypothetical protein
MCLSGNAFELQAYSFTEKISRSTLYKIVRLDFIGGNSIEVDLEHLKHEDNLSLIKNIVLEDAKGKQYNIDPDEWGVLFAAGEMTYNQYQRSKKLGTRKLLVSALGFTSALAIMAGVFINHFL